jgi:hypothetical protein
LAVHHLPDHATVARFRVRHEAAVGDPFGQALGLCADAGHGEELEARVRLIES